MIEAIKYFETETGIKIPAVTREKMIEIDRIAIKETGPNLFQMMENAGRDLTELTLALLNNRKSNILVLAGKGNNGGGGICAARHLKNHGYNVSATFAEDKITDIPQLQTNIFKAAEGDVISFEDAKYRKYEIIIDALIGYNLKGKLKANYEIIIDWANQQDSKIISLDVPSGVDANTGEDFGISIKPFCTLTLALPKTGCIKEKTGKLYLGDLGIPKNVYKSIGIDSHLIFSGDKYIIPIYQT